MNSQMKRSRGVLRTGATVPVELGVHHPPSTWMHSPTQRLSEPHSLYAFYGGVGFRTGLPQMCHLAYELF